MTVKKKVEHLGESILRVMNIKKSYKKRPVLRDISMEVRQGEVVGLLGPNGAGKTTSFYTVTGLIIPDGGKILLDDYDITSLPFYRRAKMGIGYLPQEASVFRSLTVQENIMAILEVSEPAPHKRMRRCEELMAEFSIDHLKDSLTVALSGGERRRCEIARALATNPKFILLDEPFAGVDPIAVNDIRVLVRHLKERGLGVIITDHNVRETLEITDRAYVLHDGVILAHGSAKDIVKNEAVKKVYLGEDFQY